MSWQTDLVIMTRYVINDLDSTNYSYSDSRLVTTLAIAAFQMVQEISFSTQYLVNVVAETITPDPIGPPEDIDFTTLVVLKAACILDQADFLNKNRKGSVSVKVGPSLVSQNLTAAQVAMLKLGPCGLYKRAKFEFEAGSTDHIRAIINPASMPNYQTNDGNDANKNFY